MDTILLPDYVTVLIGMTIVGIVSGNIFNSWTKDNTDKYGFTDPPRHYTTFMRFNLYRAVYILFMLSAYLLLLAFPDLIGILGMDIAEETAQKIEEQSYLWAALIVTGIVPNFPVIQTWEARLREKLQEFAFIPFEAQRMMSILEEDYQAFQPDPHTVQAVLEVIGKNKNREPDFTRHTPDSLRHKWCKLSYLYMLIGKRKADREFTRYINCCDKLLYEKLDKDYAELKQDIDKRIEFAEENTESDGADPWKTPIKVETDKLLTELLKKCYKLVSCGILVTEKLPQNRINAFHYFGLYPAIDSTFAIDWDTMLKSSLIIFSTAFLPTLVYYYYFSYFSPQNLPRIFPHSAFESLIWSLIGLTMFVPGLVGSILVERIFWHHHAKKRMDPLSADNKIVHSFIAGAIGYGIAVAVLVFIRLFQKGTFVGIKPYTFLFPLLPGVVSALSVHFIESPRRLCFKHIRQRVIEAIMVGVSSAFVGVFILLILERFDLPSLLYISATAGLIGAGVGYTFIEEYRIRMRPRKERRKEPRYAVSEEANLILNNQIIDCKVVSIASSFATVNKGLPRSGISGRLNIPSLGIIPVIVSKRRNKQTVLKLILDTLAKDKLDNYLQKIRGTKPDWTEDAAHAI